jgi:polysaccharide export outer membrane protein
MKVQLFLKSVVAVSLVCAPACMPSVCSAQLPTALGAPPAAMQSAIPSDKDVPAGQRYQVEPDDVLTINFALSPELNQTVSIHPDGYVSLFSVGSVFVQGMTVPQVVDAVKKAYSGTLHDPIIDVDLKDFQRPVFYVSGQVAKPGQYDLRYSLSVMQAIAIGGGFSPTARTQVVLLHRVSNEWAEVRVLNLRKVAKGRELQQDARVMPGDMIFVPEKVITTFRKYVPYGLGLSFSPGGNYLY